MVRVPTTTLDSELTYQTTAVNRDDCGSIDVEYGCFGSGCMMWRWEKGQIGERAPQGYCGLAGKL